MAPALVVVVVVAVVMPVGEMGCQGAFMRVGIILFGRIMTKGMLRAGSLSAMGKREGSG